jgi:NADP-dependent 3-hydroxy acid dehydrogenase YdfG
MARLAGKTAIITCAASGIGRGTAEVFAEHGARLVLVDRDGPGLEAVRAQLAGQGVEAVIFPGDVTQAATIDGVVALALAAFGWIDVVFNNAGIMPIGDLASFAETTWDEMMDVNVKAMVLMYKAREDFR